LAGDFTDNYLENKTVGVSSPRWGEDEGEGEKPEIISTLTLALSRWRERG
jgi:hypothetical protein